MKKYIVLLISIVGVLFATNVKAAKIKLPEKTDHEIVKVYFVEQVVHIVMTF